MRAMRVIYIHGVSERKSDPAYREKLKNLGNDFDSLVAEELGFRMEPISDAPWGDLRPTVELSRPNQPNIIERFGNTNEALLDKFCREDYCFENGDLNAAAYLEALILQLPRDHLETVELQAVLDLVSALHDQGARLPKSEISWNDLILANKVIDGLLSPENTHVETFGGNRNTSLAKEVVKSALDYMQAAAQKIGIRPREFLSRQLATRWSDIVWYIGAGSSIVQEKVVSDLDSITKQNSNHVNVILAHSLGGLIAFQSLNGEMFLEKRLHERGKWILLCFGSQLPVYLQLGILKSKYFSNEVANFASYRNLVDRNDPLGYFIGDDEIDIEIHTGVSSLHSHTEYLRSRIAIIESRNAIKRMI